MAFKKAVATVAVGVLRSKYAKWVICGTVGFLAEHGAQKAYDKYVMLEVDEIES